MADQQSTTCCRARSACSCSAVRPSSVRPARRSSDPGLVHLCAENLSPSEPANVMLIAVHGDGAQVMVFH